MVGKGAPIGNSRAKKLTTDELKKLAYESYCDWISKGKTHKTWRFEHKDLLLSWQTMEKYIKESPTDFPPIHKELAMSKSLEIWEEKGEGLISTQDRCQPAIYQMFMRNKFGWDKATPEEEERNTKQVAAEVFSILDKIKLPPQGA